MKLIWRRELEKWLLPEADRTIAIAGNPEFEKAHIWIINYEQLQKYPAQLSKRRLDALVLDESHYVKNPKSQRSKLARSLGSLATRRILLTGTPILNKPAELWPQLNLLTPSQWPNFFRFAQRYCNAHRNQFGWDFSGASHLDELSVRLRTSCMLRRRKSDVLDQLPAITRAMIPLEGCVLNGADGEELSTVTREIARELGLESGQSLPVELAPEDISFGCAARARAVLGKLKLAPALEFIREQSKGYSEKVVIFAHHLAVLHGLAGGLPGSVLVTGETPVPERQKAIDRFQSDPAIKYFIASIRAMSMGVTLTAASRVVFVEQDWTPAILEQAEGRCHRIGQRDAVLAQYLLVPDSIDTAVTRAVATKLEVIASTLREQPVETEN